jgi:hypothetical protein
MLEEMVYSYLKPAVDPDPFRWLAMELGGEAGLGNQTSADRRLARRLVKRAWRRMGEDVLASFPPAEEDLR